MSIITASAGPEAALDRLLADGYVVIEAAIDGDTTAELAGRLQRLLDN